jgi:hypothetical protein
VKSFPRKGKRSLMKSPLRQTALHLVVELEC